MNKSIIAILIVIAISVVGIYIHQTTSTPTDQIVNNDQTKAPNELAVSIELIELCDQSLTDHNISHEEKDSTYQVDTLNLYKSFVENKISKKQFMTKHEDLVHQLQKRLNK